MRYRIQTTALADIGEEWVIDVPDDMAADEVAAAFLDDHPDLTIIDGRNIWVGEERDREVTDVQKEQA